MSDVAKIRNVTGEDRILPWLGGRLVVSGAVVDVPTEDVYAYTCQPGWEPVDETAQKAHADAEAVHEAVEEIAEAPDAEQPSASASRDEWAAWVLGTGRASAEQIDGMGRNQLRETYGNEES